MPKCHLTFSIGPVQGFVAQARRTRDLWAGSWLLSYLSETALAAAEKAGGTAVVPFRPEAERKKVTSINSPVGGYPNRFELEFDDESAARAGALKATEAFSTAWEGVASAVWDGYVESVADKGSHTAEIWQRQIDNFWELNWVLSPPDSAGRLAAARKAFRNVTAGEEAGVKCSLMGQLQELSGFGPGAKQQAFWEALHKQCSNLDFRPGERLCAIALIKRLFPKVVDTAVEQCGTELTQQVNWPSTAFFAAHQWLRRLNDGNNKEAGESFVRSALATKKIQKGEWASAKDYKLDWATIDAQAWYRTSFHPGNDWGIEDENVLSSLRDGLSALYDATGEEPLPVYAMLLMDGDSMGQLLQKLPDPSDLSKCLGSFAVEVKKRVKEHFGETIYAGGDDVLAILPPEHALAAATELALDYREAFKDAGAGDAATLSGAILFAHWKYPLRQVMHEAHRLLDEVAKDRTGRNSLAIGVLLGSGLNALWSAPWPVVRGEREYASALTEIVELFSLKDIDQEEAKFNASYLYKMRALFSKLLPRHTEVAGAFETIPEGSPDILAHIAHAEYRRRMSKDDRATQLPDATKGDIEKLMSLSRRWCRSDSDDNRISVEAASFGFDGWRIGRTLKEIKENRMLGHD